MKRKYLLFLHFIISISFVFSQNNEPYQYNLTAYKNYFKDKFGVEFSFPKNLKSIDKYHIDWKVRSQKGKCLGSVYGPFFLTKDKKCMIAFPYNFYGFFGTDKEVDKLKYSSFYFHAKSQVAGELETSLDMFFCGTNTLNKEMDDSELYKYVDVVFGKKARAKYNADAYSISDLPDGYKTFFSDKDLEKLRKEKYPYCTSLFIQKYNAAVLDIKFFFTEKGFKKKEKYIKMLDKHIWFDENFKSKKEE